MLRGVSYGTSADIWNIGCTFYNCLLKRRVNVSGYLATLLTVPLRLNTNFSSKVRDQVRVRLRVRVRGA